MKTNWFKLLTPILQMFESIDNDGAGPDQISLNNQQLAREMENKITGIFVQLSNNEEYIHISNLNRPEYEQFLSLVRQIDIAYQQAIVRMDNREQNKNDGK